MMKTIVLRKNQSGPFRPNSIGFTKRFRWRFQLFRLDGEEKESRKQSLPARAPVPPPARALPPSGPDSPSAAVHTSAVFNGAIIGAWTLPEKAEALSA